jgi:hypothetical protein
MQEHIYRGGKREHVYRGDENRSTYTEEVMVVMRI